MADRGILMDGESLRAILAGKKTQTRRLSKRWLKVKAGQGLWVRESMKVQCGCAFRYCADAAWLHVPDKYSEWYMRYLPQRICPSIHMPRWASRILLEATADAREERLQEITEEDAMAEGCRGTAFGDGPNGDEGILPSSQFGDRWDSLHPKPPHDWASNPRIVVLEFRVMEIRQ